jgi:diguanylate cyclase (GGDEF)-like protein
VVALAVALVALAVTAMMIPGLMVDPFLTRNKSAQAQSWSNRVTEELTAGASTFVAATVTPEDAVLLDAVTRTSDILGLNLIAADGRIFWASEADRVGTFHPISEHNALVAQGQTTVAIDTSRAVEMEAHAEEIHDHALPFLAEVDTPVLLDGVVVGRFEYFMDVTAERALLIRRLRELIGALIGVAAFFGGAFFIAVMRDNRRRVAAIKERAAREQEILSDQLRLGREVRLLGDLNSWLQTSRSLDELFEMSARFLTHLMPDSEGSIYVYSNSRDVLDGCASWNGGTHKAHINPDECWGLRRGRTYVFGDGEVDFTCAHAEPHDGRPYLCIPVLAHGETVGLMHLRARDTESTARFAEARRLAQMCAEQISLAIANVRMRDQLQDQSIRDPLTGLFNRRHMIDSLRRSLATLGRGNETVAIVAIDVDHFKRFNDNHGHDAGDMVLRAVAAALAELCDRDELACRIGGEELMILLPGVGADEAMARAEEMRAAVEAVTVRYGEKALPRVTISLGVALAPVNGRLPQDLLRAADDALYAAKARGRNQTVLAGTQEDTREPWAEALAEAPAPSPVHAPVPEAITVAA